MESSIHPRTARVTGTVDTVGTVEVHRAPKEKGSAVATKSQDAGGSDPSGAAPQEGKGTAQSHLEFLVPTLFLPRR